MTIRVKVANDDSRDTAVIAVQLQNQDGSNQSTPAKELKGGEGSEFLVHSTQQLLVKEIRNG